MDAHNVLTQPFAWETLKRFPFAAEVRAEPLKRNYGVWTTVSPEDERSPTSWWKRITTPGTSTGRTSPVLGSSRAWMLRNSGVAAKRAQSRDGAPWH